MTEVHLTGNLIIQGPVGRLEAIYKAPAKEDDSAITRVAVVAHPHPAHGGTMHNKVVYRAAQALNQAGLATVRFNYRGVGLSDGVYDEGRGERDDLRAVIDYVCAKFPTAELTVAGFSFGAWIGLDIGCHDPRAKNLLGIGTPLRVLQVNDLRECDKPKLFVQGANDQFGPIEELLPWYERLPEPKKLVLVEGADHFFNGHLDKLVTAIREYFSR